MSNNSTVNGYLQPGPGGPLEGNDLLDFLQQWIVGITGLPPEMVRPSYQSEPPNPPDAGTIWAAFWVNTTDSDTFPYVGHDPLGDGADRIQRHERMDMLVSFFDLGISGQAVKYARILRDGTAIEQNAYQLKPGSMALVSVGNIQPAPSLFKQRWMYRVDLPIRIARQDDRIYPVFSIDSMEGELDNDVGLPPRDISVPHP